VQKQGIHIRQRLSYLILEQDDMDFKS
jgi:hypothetical protein